MDCVSHNQNSKCVHVELKLCWTWGQRDYFMLKLHVCLGSGVNSNIFMNDG